MQLDAEVVKKCLKALLLKVGRRVSGGYQALFRFELPACYHPNLGIFWGVWLFQKETLSKKDPNLE